MTEEELTNVFKHIVKKCDMLINNDHYEADTYTQDTVEDIAELCNYILDGNYGKLVEVKEVNLETLLHPSKMNNNLFKEVYFGKPYKTRDGRKALYCYKITDNSHALIIEGDEEFWYVRDDGLIDDWDDSYMDSAYYTDKDIISEW